MHHDYIARDEMVQVAVKFATQLLIPYFRYLPSRCCGRGSSIIVKHNDDLKL